VPGDSISPAVVRGFGAVFTDVDLADTTKIEYFDTGLNLVYTQAVPPSPTAADGGLSFAGVSFPDGPPIGKVVITAGNTAIDNGVTEDPTHDLVVMDDFLYTEPQPPGTDGDGIPDGSDNCPAAYNPDQLDTDGDGQGNVCDSDDDGDGISDADELGKGTDPLKADSDGDGRSDNADNCPVKANPNQADADGDGIGDVCDPTPLPPDVRAPVITKAKLKPAKFKRSRGTKLRLTLSEPAKLRLTFKRGKKVVKRSTKTGKLGLNKFTLKPKLKRGRSYKLAIIATDAAGNKSAVKTLSFKIKR
jgi:hypothetical protein